MAGNAFLISTLLLMALGLLLLQECQFLIPYRGLLFQEYVRSIVLFAAVLFVNVFAATYMVSRKLFLKDTGRKLEHLEKQLRTETTLSEELSQRLQE